MCGLGSIGDALNSINPLSSENCAYQHPRPALAIAEGAACAASLGVGCVGLVGLNLGIGTRDVIKQGIDTGWRDPGALAAREAINLAQACSGLSQFGVDKLAAQTSGRAFNTSGKVALKAPSALPPGLSVAQEQGRP